LSSTTLNAATLVSAFSPAFYPSVTPGELISLTGFGIGPDTGVGYPPGARQIPLSLGGAQVLFDKQPVPVLYAQSRQINAVAPADFGDRTLTDITVVYNGVTFGPVTAAVAPLVPGLFRLRPGTSLQAFALNQDGAMNSAANPAEPGSVVTLLGTGFAPPDPSCAPGSFSGSQSIPLASPASTSVVFIGTQQVEYLGSAPYQPCGISEIQIRVPNDARSGHTLIVPQSQQLVGATIFVK
jgi:uncharacterized protein (TIGR03437 family)